MKKSFLALIAVPALLLTGCDFKFSRYVFKKKAAEVLRDIETHPADVDGLKESTFAIEEHTDASYVYEGQNGNYKLDNEISAEFSVDKTFCHYKVYKNEEESLGSSSNKYSSGIELWAFLTEGKLCVALKTNTVNNGTSSESKYYTYASDYSVAFNSFISGIKTEVKRICDDKTYAKQIAASFEGSPIDGFEYKSIWNFTKGDGYFSSNGKAELKDYDYEGYKSNGKAKVKIAWENYFLTKLKIEADITCKAPINGHEVDLTVKEKIDGKASFKAKEFSLDLSGFTYQG